MPLLPPVPDCEGPKLDPYRADGTPDICFLECLGQGLHGYVFKVKIDGKIFALKVFKVSLVDGYWITAAEDWAEKIDVALLRAQWLPFNAECRAYARLKEARKEHLAVRCHGYVQLTDAQKKELETRFEIAHWGNSSFDWENVGNWDAADQEDVRREFQKPLYAIVKDFVEGDAHFAPKDAERMLSNVHQLHRCGIVAYDLKEDAYVNGTLVDFSKAVVAPHLLFDGYLGPDPEMEAEYDSEAREAVYGDLAQLGSMFEDWNIVHRNGPKIGCRTKMENRSAFVPRKAAAPGVDFLERCFNLRKFNWKKFSERRPRASFTDKARAVNNSGKQPSIVSKRKNPKGRKRKLW